MRSSWSPACSGRCPRGSRTAARARIRAARFPARKSPEEFDFDHARGLKRDLIAHLGPLDFVTGRENVVFLGRPGPARPTPVTSLAPIQFQKHIRLQAARLLLANHPNDTTGVGHLVGYDNPSQFSPENRRQFGAPPSLDAERMHGGADLAAAFVLPYIPAGRRGSCSHARGSC
jgi:hypothetical protein